MRYGVPEYYYRFRTNRNIISVLETSPIFLSQYTNGSKIKSKYYKDVTKRKP
jgi:hypothetical protein